MSGIYLHIPFCRKACHYCDFHFSTNTGYRDRMVDALRAEIRNRSDFLRSRIETVYFGGGTPSVLDAGQIQQILSDIAGHFDLSGNPEITLEANPDDLNREYCRDIQAAGVNRLSIGVQSFDADVLEWMNRSHNASQSVGAVRDAQDLGFDNITIDLILGIPGRRNDYWTRQLEKATDLDVNHLSVYALTVESKTVLDHRIRKGLQNPPIAEDQAEQFLMTIAWLTGKGYEHYEISNYARQGFRSRHNSSYWSGLPYLGIGPSAHSYNGSGTRSWNVANNQHYMKGMENGEPVAESEILTNKDRINEYILTRLRTSEGLSMEQCLEKTGHAIDRDDINPWLESGKMKEEKGTLYLTNEGKLMADAVASSLFVL